MDFWQTCAINDRNWGNILSDFLKGGGQNVKKNCRQKHKKSLFFKFKGGKSPPATPNDISGPTIMETAKLCVAWTLWPIL